MKSLDNNSHTKDGFTLIELLTVIAIVAVLAGILIPAVGAVRKKAHEATSQSNLRQLGVLFQLYGTESKGSLPYGYTGSQGWDVAFVEANLIKEEELRALVYTPLQEGLSEFPRSYSMTRGYWNGVAQTNPATPPTKLLKVEKPSQTLLLAERFHPNNTYGWSAFSVINSPKEQTDAAPDRTIFNYLFVDGHVEALTPEQTIGTGSVTQPAGYWSINPND